MKYLITGATGQLGSAVVEHLLTLVPAETIAVSVRDPKKADSLKAKGIDVRHGDFDQPDTLKEAFKGVDRLLVVSSSTPGPGRIEQHKAAIDAAKEAGVQLLAYTSIVNAEKSTASLADDHRATEQFIKESGIPYLFLRNNWYLENEAGTIQAVQQGAPWVHATDDAKVGWAPRREYAVAAAEALVKDGIGNSTFELSGGLRTTAELAAIVQSVIGQEVAVHNVTDEQFAAGLTEAGLPDFVVGMLTGMQGAIRGGALSVESSDLETLLGRPVQPLEEVIGAIVKK